MFSSFKIQDIISKLPGFSPYTGLLRNYAVIASVRQYLIYKFPVLTWSMRKQYLMFKCLVLSIELFFPFSCSRIVLLLSCYRIFYYTLYPWDYINKLFHSIIFDYSFVPNNSASVLIFVLSFFL